MQLSRIERLILSNQFTILAALAKNEHERKALLTKALALESGYEGEYDDAFYSVDAMSMPEALCSEVRDTIQMFQMLQTSLREAGSSNPSLQNECRFPGYDGNEEPRLLGYARFLIENRDWKSSLDYDRELNTHMPVRARYATMRQKWNAAADRFRLTLQEIADITAW